MRLIPLLRIGIFLLLLVWPLATMRGAGAALPHEQRVRVTRPSLREGARFPEQFDAYFRDNFGWRDRVIRWRHLFKYRVLGESPVADVIVGRNGWLFYSNPSDGLDIRNFGGHWPHDPGDVDGWLRGQEGRRQQYARLGARYLIAVAPDKQSLYPQFVPFRYGPQAPGVMGELLARLSSYPDLTVLDLRSHLREAGGELYYKGDTHWNGQGAFTAASVIADRLRRDLPSVGAIRESDYAVEESMRQVGDLTNMMGLGLPANDRAFTFRRRSGGAREIRSTPLNRVFEQPVGGLPKAVLLGDSFGEALAPLLADAFSRLHYYRSSIGGPNPALIVEEAPGVVILISAERYLPHLGGR
jgi:alginate O-acetyltransferase complex protein AlgJ